MSPEQTGRMNRHLDYRTDYYSLGITFYQLLTGKLPFEAEDALEWVHCHISRQPTPVNKLNRMVPAALSAIVAKLIAKNSEDRYQSSYGLVRDLEICLEEFNKGFHDVDFELGNQTYLIIFKFHKSFLAVTRNLNDSKFILIMPLVARLNSVWYRVILV